MKKPFLLFLIFCLTATGGFAGVITLEGIYQGKNLYIQNPFTSSGVGFCTTDVFVNDIRSTDELQSSAFEIDLGNFRLKMGDKVFVRIKHKDDCTPKILNPEVLKPSSTFEILSTKAEDNGSIKWNTRNEGGPLPFVVEQFRWNKWVKATEVQGKGGPAENSYSAKVNYHSGLNKFRIQQTDFKGPHYSKEIQYKSAAAAVSFYPIKATNDINFSSETLYEIYDQYGALVKRGNETKVDVSNLAKGPYYLNYDNKTETFFKK